MPIDSKTVSDILASVYERSVIQAQYEMQVPFLWGRLTSPYAFVLGFGGNDFTTMLCENRQLTDNGLAQARMRELQRRRDQVTARLRSLRNALDPDNELTIAIGDDDGWRDTDEDGYEE